MPTSPQAVFADLASALGVTELVPLAQGGQKFVLRALREGRPVAVKAMLVPPGPAYALALDRATRETGVLAAVDSPRLVRLRGELRELIFDGDLPYGVAWAEELLDGVDLDKLLGRPWATPDVARLLVHLAEALAALHAKGIVHRDLNPGNVRRRENGEYCLMDPGLAHFLADGDQPDAGGIGTPGYLSPEHAPGRTVRPSSDVYCLGILVHQALTGGLPGESSLTPDTPMELLRIVERCLRPDPDERFADGETLLDELAGRPELFGRFFAGSADSALDDRIVASSLEPPTSLFTEPCLAYSACGDEAMELRGAFGTRRLDVEDISRDQQPFAVRLAPSETEIAPGVTFAARTIELDGGARITNSYELAVDTNRATVGVHSSRDGFYLPDLLGGSDGLGTSDVPGGAARIAAVSGSFSYISDDFEYEPAEFGLDFCARDGVMASLPTVAKPAFIVGPRNGVELRELDARGTLRIGGTEYPWIGSKVPVAHAANPECLIVFGAANCRVEYTEAKRTALLRGVNRETNRTSTDAGVIDLVVTREAGSHDGGGHVGGRHVIKAVHAGGGADLFEGSFILRGSRALVDGVRPGDEVDVRSVGGVACSEIESGFSVGPTVAAAGRGETLVGYDESLGLPPFLPGARYARTLIGLTGDGVLRLRVLDGAPLSRTFQGVSCAETAQILEADGHDPERFHHLDGGQSSKLAFRRGGGGDLVVLGSMHYLLWPKQDVGAFLWRGRQGRLLRSALTVSLAGWPAHPPHSTLALRRSAPRA